MLRDSVYWLSQSARVGWFLGHYLLVRRLLTSAEDRARSAAHPPTIRDLVIDMAALLRTDWENIRAGLYRLPDDLLADPVARIGDSVRYFQDLPAVVERRRRNGFDDVVTINDVSRRYPDYFLRNFHFQTDGYLSDRSARLYDQQVEVLFFGAADAMRRQALVPLARWLRRHRITESRLLDVACGTGRFLAMVKDNHPRLSALGVDLSPFYLAAARRRLRPWSRLQLVQGLAERLPVADASVDLVTCVYFLHEVPGRIRSEIAREVARVLRPGGRLIVVDSLQLGDKPEYDRMLLGFPRSFHEPYYEDYIGTDVAALFAAEGLAFVGRQRAFLSKVVTFDKA